MNQNVSRRRCALAFLMASLALLLVLPVNASAGRPQQQVPDGGYGPNNRPVYYVISMTPDFIAPHINKVTGGVMNQADDMGSQVLVVKVGEYIAGQDIGDTRYVGDDLAFIDVSNLPHPDTGEPMDPEMLNGSQVTVLGSFCTFSEQVHMVTPDPAPIQPQVQEAFFRASALFEGNLPPFPTTVELACFIYDNQGDAGADVNDILDAIMATDMRLTCTTCFAEGDLFPHEPTEEVLFTFDARFDTDSGDFELNICLPIEVWIKGQSGTNPFNLGSNGVLPVVIPTTEYFDAVAEIDVSTLQIGTFMVDEAGLDVFVGVPIVKSSIADQDGDGDLDLVVHFDTQSIVGLDGVDEYTTELRFSGKTKLGMCIEGSDKIRIVPPSK